MIKVENLTFSYKDTPLYTGVTFRVNKGQKVGLVGGNGSGKSTLLKIITGREHGFTGKVVLSGTYAGVPQEVKYDPDMEASRSAREYVDPDYTHEDHELYRLFSGLELDIDLSADPRKFSGGQKTKLALARALVKAPDVLLLDEPTNFMDVAGKRWVMDFLGNYDGAAIVISHDLELMDKAIDKVLAINVQSKLIEEYKGSYSDYIRLKAQREDLLKRQVMVKQKHIKQMEEGLHKMTRFTSAKGVRARVRQQRRIERERLELPEVPREIKTFKIRLPNPANVGEIPVRAIGLTKSYGELTIFQNLDFSIVRGQRIALVGPNGSGKSTFVKILLGLGALDSGEVVINDQTKIGYYSQEFETFNFNDTVLDTFIDKTKTDERFARAFLGRFMFSGDRVHQRVESLSGGEKTRLSIAMITGVDNNLLVLDEPTTYLDVLSQRIILESLKEYKGSMILVSHTPEFVKELKPDKALLFPEGKLKFWDDKLLDLVDVV